MAENEEDYLRRCREEGICPACQKHIVTKYGSGNPKEGVFCSLSCYGTWNVEVLKRRHEDRLKKGDK